MAGGVDWQAIRADVRDTYMRMLTARVRQELDVWMMELAPRAP